MNRTQGWLAAAVALSAWPLTACGSPLDDCGSIPTTPKDLTTTGEHSYYPKEAVDYFSDIAFGSEYGGGPKVIHRWTEDVRIRVHGDPTEADKIALCQVVSEIDALTQTVEVSVIGSGQNVDLYFIPQSRFSSIVPDYVPGNVGYFSTFWDETQSLTEAQILISTSGTLTREERNHLIREEVTQAMGLMRDSHAYADSIFYQPWSEVQEYSDLDRMLIEMLYLPQITPGMTVEEARAVISYW